MVCPCNAIRGGTALSVACRNGAEKACPCIPCLRRPHPIAHHGACRHGIGRDRRQLHHLHPHLRPSQTIAVFCQRQIVENDVRQPAPRRRVGDTQRRLHARIGGLCVRPFVDPESGRRVVAGLDGARIRAAGVVVEIRTDPDAPHAGDGTFAQTHRESRRVSVGARRALAAAALASGFFLGDGFLEVVVFQPENVSVDCHSAVDARDDSAVGAGLHRQIVEARPVDRRPFGRVEVAAGHHPDLRTVERSGRAASAQEEPGDCANNPADCLPGAAHARPRKR